ncbi:PREDICTED: uncharacterized protein LOC103335726 [Prunus mume]|uniref:Uncharacterized protein LOC103335726 n=1 Tax=Prunus mume TaxID=102107 RepID=A0ABM0PB42_PRUMU|nr:PREDICTED: uncharacterized protein LOC103335726 [Prunus mume]
MAAASVVGAPTCHRLHCLLHRPSPPSSSFSLFLKPLLISTTTVSTTPFIPHRRIISPSLPSLPSRPLFFCHSSTLSHSPPAPEASLQEAEETQQLEIPEDDDNDNGEEAEIEIENLDNKENAQVGLESSSGLKRDGVKPPSLTVKEKKELASYAHSLGKKLKSQLVGKSGVTASVAASFVENLESNELLKVKIHGTCPGELDDVVKQLEEATGSVIVGQIGRTVILYRPSLTKLKAEEKRQQMRKVFMRRKTYSRPTSVEFQKKGERPRTFGRDSRGRTRV